MIQSSETARTLVSNEEDVIGDYAVDYVKNMIYWSEPDRGRIQRATLNGKNPITLYHGVGSPASVALDLNQR